MGKLNIFEITLCNFPGVFYAGQNVQGHCTAELNEEMSMRGIRLKFEGKAYVHWTEKHTTGSGKDRKTHTKHYSATEIYFNQEVVLYGRWPGQANDTTRLAPGRHTFPFCFMLPPSLPSSFEGAHGYVRYSVKATIDKPWKFDHTTKKPFTVIGLLDLNADPEAQMPSLCQKQKMLCCWCCASGPITAEFRLERRGYVPGEPIRLFADIYNNSNRKMDKSYIDLRMVTTFYAQFRSRPNFKEVARITQGPIEAGQSYSWEGQQLVIPPLPPSYLTGCKIIDIRYILQLNVDPSGMSFDLDIPLKIIIGTIPLRQVMEHYPPRPAAIHPPPQAEFGPPPGTMYPPPGRASAPYQPMDPSATPMQPTMPSMPSNFPPPAYSECVLGKVSVKDDDDNEHTRGSLDFAPAYTYYDWGHQPTTMDGEH